MLSDMTSRQKKSLVLSIIYDFMAPLHKFYDIKMKAMAARKYAIGEHTMLMNKLWDAQKTA